MFITVNTKNYLICDLHMNPQTVRKITAQNGTSDTDEEDYVEHTKRSPS